MLKRKNGATMPEIVAHTGWQKHTPNGTVCESVVFSTSRSGCDLTDDKLDRWVAGFPVEEDGLRSRHYRHGECGAGARPNARHCNWQHS